MSPFQVPEGPYTIENIMESIRAQVIERPNGSSGSGEPAGNGAEKTKETPRPLVSDGRSTSQLLAQLELLRQRQDLNPGYQIKSHRPVIGAVFNFIKRVIHWGSRPYTDAIRVRQEAFNESALQALREVSLQLDALAARQQKSEQAQQQLRADLETQAAGQRQLFARDDLAPFFAALPPERRLSALDENRGTFEDIQYRQSVYSRLLKGAPGQVLDVGCGRGELLNLLRLEGIECWGAELDPLMVEQTRKLGVHALQMDALSALESVAPASLGGVFAGQVVEHFYPGELLRFLLLARAKLARGGRIILETLNPASLGVLAKSYYRDLDHKQPIHPEYLKLLLELAGFSEVELHYLYPFGEDEKLPALPPAEKLGLSAEAHAALQTRFDRLNGLLFGAQDYFVTARQMESGEPDATTTSKDSSPA